MAKDIYHDAVKTALIKDGWTILNEGYRLEPDDKTLFLIDILAEKYIIAKKEKQLIVVEVKGFHQRSKNHEFHAVIGQYITYQDALEYLRIKRKLYLAIPINIYEDLFKRPFAQYVVRKHQINLLPYHPIKKILVK